LFVLLSFTALGQSPFITTWKTDNPGVSEDNQIMIPGSGTYDVYWKAVADSNVNDQINGLTGDSTITFPSPGTYRAAISVRFEQIFVCGGGDSVKIIAIDQCGDISWSTMAYGFQGAVSLESDATDAPDLSRVTNTRFMFCDASSFNGEISDLDVSGVANM